jgi:hypothetical protein
VGKIDSDFPTTYRPPPTTLRLTGSKYARNYYVAMYGMQAKELQQDQEQEDHDGAVGAQEILRCLPQASAT